ncbi:MAG: adenosylmethionine--8-amino-7-oxononanoate transaminase [Myxococcota bacterium]
MTFLWRPYTQMKTEPPALPVRRTEGCFIELEDGTRLLDGIASWWTACHGYNHPHIRARVAAQLAEMPHVMFGGLTHAPAEELAARLARQLPGDLDHVFFTESGSVSVEVGLKMAIQTQLNRGRPEKTRWLSFLGGYHGDTFATMALCDPGEGMHRRFQDVLPRRCTLRLPTTPSARARFEAWMQRHAHRFAVMVVEPLVQAAGGFLFHDVDTLRFLRKTCTEHDVLLLFDEIAVAFGRLGYMFAADAAGVVPDIITLSKALTGGTLPLAATVARTPIFEAFLSDRAEDALMHGPTYMANAMGCAAAHGSLDLFDREPRLEQARRMEGWLSEGLEAARKLPGVREVRCRGALGVVELDRIDDLAALRRRFVQEGVWIRPLGRVVYLMPPLVMERDQVRVLTDAIIRVLSPGRTR